MHCFARKHLGCYVLIAATVLGIARPAPAATGEQINAAINRAKDWLYKQEHDGNWEEVPAPMGSVGSDLRGLQWGGSTAIAVYALLAAGESRNDPRLVQAIEFLKKTELRGTYAVALRCQVWQLLASDRELRPLIEADASLMLGGMYSSGPHAGMFAYGVKGGPQPPGYFDHSVSQYGVLGLWALEQAGANIPVNNWRLIDQGWRADQHSDGGWSYSDSAALPLHQGSTASMTAAGLASLFIAQDYLQMDSPICRTVVPNENIDRALHWMDQNIDTIFDNPGSYTMYGIERIGTASGRKYFATKPWYDRGVDLLLSHQSEHGSWGLVHDTCFSLLFLVRGRAPIMMNKLQYEVNGITPGVAYEGPWNERPRDLANFARWLSRDLERDLNWQIVNLKVAPDDLSDAPVLYIGGSDELRLSDESANHLREFVEQGGLILGNPDCEKEPFIEGFKALGRRLFPHYEFRELEPSHPIFTNEQYPSVNWKERPSVLGLSNGVRELMILAPHADLGRYWQLNREKGHELPYQLGANIFLYAIDKSDLRFRSTSRVVQANNGRAAANEIRLARIQAGDNPDPEPGGWRRLAAIMHNEDSVDIETVPVKLDAEALRGFKIAHLTGTTTLQLTDDQRKALSAFAADGGTLIVEAAGGSLAFADSAQAQLQRTFGDEAAKALANPLLPIDPLYSKTQARISEVSYRSFLHPSLKGDLKSPRLRAWNHNGHMAVIFSREDISGGLVGEPVDGIRGYSPQSATDLMRAILLYASGVNPS